MESLGIFDMDLDSEKNAIDTPYILDNISQKLEEFILDEAEADAEDCLFNIIEEISNSLQKIAKN